MLEPDFARSISEVCGPNDRCNWVTWSPTTVLMCRTTACFTCRRCCTSVVRLLLDNSVVVLQSRPARSVFSFDSCPERNVSSFVAELLLLVEQRFNCEALVLCLTGFGCFSLRSLSLDARTCFGSLSSSFSSRFSSTLSGELHFLFTATECLNSATDQSVSFVEFPSDSAVVGL